MAENVNAEVRKPEKGGKAPRPDKAQKGAPAAPAAKPAKPRELRAKNHMKILSLAPEVL